MKRLHMSCWVIAAVCAPTPLDAAQDVGVLTMRRAGSIELRKVADLGDEDEAALGPSYTMDRAPSGEWLVSPLVRRDEILVFSPEGRFLRTVGRSGQGPGEYRFVRHVVAGDSLVHVIDTRNARWTRLRPGDWSVEGTSSFPMDATDVLAVGDSLLLANANVRTPERIGYPLHTVTAARGIAMSFGVDENPAFRSDMSFLTLRQVTGGPDQSYWVAHGARYRLERFAADGRPLEALDRDAAWFRPREAEALPSPDQPPAPLVSDLRFDPDTGLLWVAVSVADANWVEGLGKGRYAEGSGYVVQDWDKYLDTVIEVIDPARGEVLASVRVDPLLWKFVGNSHAASYFETKEGSPRIAVWHIGLELDTPLRDTAHRLADSLSRGDLNAVAAQWRAAWPGTVRWNEARGAIQVVGCQGDVVGSIPVPEVRRERVRGIYKSLRSQRVPLVTGGGA